MEKYEEGEKMRGPEVGTDEEELEKEGEKRRTISSFTPVSPSATFPTGPSRSLFCRDGRCRRAPRARADGSPVEVGRSLAGARC
jgi:hypothetical protein